MNGIQTTGVMIGLFALRCIAPLLLTMTLLHLMNRLLDRWAALETTPASALTVLAPSPAATSTPSISLACWLLHNCSEEERARCAAYRRQNIPCWQARLIEEGKLPDGCPTCPKYRALPLAA